MSAIYAWLRRHPTLVDSVLAGVLALFAFPTIWLHVWPQTPITALLVAPVAVRRRIPIIACAIAECGALLQVLTERTPSGGESGATIAVLVLLYTVAAYRPRRWSILALSACLVGSVTATFLWPGAEAGPHLIARLAFGGVLVGSAALTWLLGDSMRFRRAYYAALEDRAARLEAERDAQARIAAAAERARIARELHDVIAHHVSVMVVQADGAGYALRSDPDTAQSALKAIAGTGRQALTEMRRLLGVLRTGDEQAQLAPMPGLGELRELLDQARSAGLAVSYTLLGTPRDLPEGAELAAYRVVQESLTNTRKHAGLAASAAVTLRYEPFGLIVEVTDNGLASPAGEVTGGHGLAGMRERIAMYGGTVQAGPLPGGGFGVVARLPCAETPASTAAGTRAELRRPEPGQAEQQNPAAAAGPGSAAGPLPGWAGAAR
ncbi:MAG TPA: histidine kinase [Streptosporangiaceae bacterium]|nr:histidine kinase [Streptosporangiaceae bacterium]